MPKRFANGGLGASNFKVRLPAIHNPRFAIRNFTRLSGALALGALLHSRIVVAEEPPVRSPDVFAQALGDLGLTESDLGQRPLGFWNRYPHPSAIPYVMPYFSDLLAHPLATYEFTRTLGNAIEDALTPEKLHDKPKTLYWLGVVLATERRIGGFRGYSANLDPRPALHEPLLHALIDLNQQAGAPRRPESTFERPERPHNRAHEESAELRASAAAIPAALQVPLARFILNLIDAHVWIDRGLRRVPQELRDAVFDTLPRLVAGTSDGTEYFPAIDDVARLIDEESLWYGCLKALQATQDARREIDAVPVPARGWPPFALRVPTPWGTILIDHDTKPRQVLRVDDPLLIVRVGTAGPLRGPVGATGRRRPLSVALLLDGTPSVGCATDTDTKDCESAALATGVLGCGIVYAAGDQPTSYRSNEWGMGAGLFGLGALIDEGGNDDYRMHAAGMGAAFFGAGLLLDASGNDRYTLDAGDGQGFGGPGGIGILADRSGNDSYYAEPDAAKSGHGDYHSGYQVSTSFAQGVGVGRRGDGSDGHAWAGGLGALLDVDGNDMYQAGNFSLGTGYWYGTGLLWDGGGSDTYRSAYYTQGSGAHFAIGALVDEGGDDQHLLEHTAGAALGFGWDGVNAFLIDRGAGNDRYEALIDSIGYALHRSQAFFIDDGGNDTYVLARDAHGSGEADQLDTYATPARTAAVAFHQTQIGLFLDCGGTDTYLRRQEDGTLVPDAQAGDDRTWHLRANDPAARGGFNVSIGKDLPAGRIGFLDPWPARQQERGAAAVGNERVPD